MSMSGIYCIEDGRGVLYYGSATNLKKRISNHKTFLRQGKHQNPKLQRAWSKYGPDFFSFYVVEVVTDKNKLLEREQWWIDNLVNSGLLYYNINLVAGSQIGRECSDETRQKISKSNTGKKRSAEHIEWLSKTKKGIKYGKYPERSADFKNNVALTRSGGKLFTFVDVNGNVYENITNLTAFCREHGLQQQNMQKVTTGAYKSHKGFRLVKVEILEEYKK